MWGAALGIVTSLAGKLLRPIAVSWLWEKLGPKGIRTTGIVVRVGGVVDVMPTENYDGQPPVQALLAQHMGSKITITIKIH